MGGTTPYSFVTELSLYSLVAAMGARHLSGPPGDLAVPPNGGGGIRKITWLNGYCPQYLQLDMIHIYLRPFFLVSAPPRLLSLAPSRLLRPVSSLPVRSSAVLCPSAPSLPFFLLQGVAALAQALSLATTQSFVSAKQ